MKSTHFVLSDEQVNSYGFKVATLGINLERFRKNPVMLYQHDVNRVIGRWEQIEVKDGRLTAVPVFEQEDDFARSIGKKVENGFIKGASIGMHVQEVDKTGAMPIATRTELFEASVCAIPSNGNALRVLDAGGNLMTEQQIALTLSLPHAGTNLAQQLAVVLGLRGATDQQLIDAVKQMKQAPINQLIEKSMSEGRFTAHEKDHFTKILQHDFQAGKALIERLPKKKSLLTMLEQHQAQQRQTGQHPQQWTLDDYRKNDPQYLRKNPQLYQQLLEKEINKQHNI